MSEYNDFYKSLRNGRCNPCKFARVVTASAPSWMFLGCYHRPYNGKWVAEIKDCPLDARQCEVDRSKEENMLYHKIETIYNRATDGTKKLIEGDWRNPAVQYLKDNFWEFTEKIDGTNIRVIWDGHSISFGGRTERTQIPAHLMNRLIELFKNDETEQLFEQKFGEMEVVLFGEGYGHKIQNGGLYRSDVSFILFDVMINGNYQPRDSVVDIAMTFGLEIVPIVLTGDIDAAVEFVKNKPKSTIGKAPMEGVVGRPLVEMKDRTGNRVIIKIKVNDFAE